MLCLYLTVTVGASDFLFFMAQMEDDAVDIQQLLAEPENEENLMECLGGM